LVYRGEPVLKLIEKIEKTKADKVIFDEVQFFPPAEVKLTIAQLRKKGIHVIAAGLLYDYKRQPFGVTPELIGLADEYLELFSVCQKCGSIARHSERVKGGKGKVVVGAADKYIASCEKCHKIYI
jgi:thymidine kinase